MKMKLWLPIVVLTGFALSVSAPAQSSANDFYKDKTISANYTYNSGKPDGLFVGIWNSALVLRQALGDKAMRFDARKFGLAIGARMKARRLVALWPTQDSNR